MRQGAAGLRRAELRARVGGQPAAAVGEGSEGPRRGAAPGQRGARRARLVLDREPAAQFGHAQAVRRVDAVEAGVGQQRGDVAGVGADGVR